MTIPLLCIYFLQDFFFKDSWVGVIFGLVGESQHVDTRKNIGEIRTGLVDSCGENDAKLERRKKNILQNIIISIFNVQATLNWLNLLWLSHW